MQTLDLGLCLHCVVTNLIHFSRGLDMLGHIIKILFLITILFWISTAETTLTAVLSAAVTPTEVSPTEVLPTWKPATSIKGNQSILQIIIIYAGNRSGTQKRKCARNF